MNGKPIEIVSYGRNRSLVRKIAMLLPEWLFPKPVRVPLGQYLVARVKPNVQPSDVESISSIGFSEEDEDEYDDDYDDDDDDYDDDEDDSDLDQQTPPNNNERTPVSTSEENEGKLLEIEKQLKELRQQVGILLSKQTLADIKIPNVPFVPPPPPPPLPTLFTPNYTKFPRKIFTSTPPSNVVPPASISQMDNVLKEIGNVKLKPVKKSPKRSDGDDNVTKDLQAILRRRYLAMHAISPKHMSNWATNSDSFTEAYN